MRIRLTLGVMWVAVATGCAAVLGFEDTQIRPDDAGADDAASPDGSLPPADATPGEPGVDVSPSPLVVRRGASAELAVTIRRGGTVGGPLTLRLDGLPPGVSAPPVAIDATATTARIVVTASVGAPLGAAVARVRSDAPALPEAPITIAVADRPGLLDTTFDGDGLVSDASRGLAATFYAVGLQGDGKIVAAGAGLSGWMARRFADTGAAEPAFTTASAALPTDGEVRALAVDASGRVILAGTSAPGVAQPAQLTVVRLTPAGAVDATFAGGAFRLGAVDAPLGSTALAIAIQPDGAIVVAGSRRDPATVDGGPTGSSGVALRLTPDGGRDNAFGLVKIAQNRFVGVALEDGGVVLAGTDLTAGPPQPSFFLARRTAQGGVDSTFGVGGTLDFGAGVRANGFARRSDGALAVVGELADAGDGGAVVAGLSAKGGAQVWFRGASSNAGRYSAAAWEADGRLVAAGHAASEARVDVLLSDGGADPAFADGGTSFVEPPGAGPFTVTLFATAVAPDGRILVAGNRSDAGAVVYRLWP